MTNSDYLLTKVYRHFYCCGSAVPCCDVIMLILSLPLTKVTMQIILSIAFHLLNYRHFPTYCSNSFLVIKIQNVNEPFLQKENQKGAISNNNDTNESSNVLFNLSILSITKIFLNASIPLRKLCIDKL